jgi:hypothetical protein
MRFFCSVKIVRVVLAVAVAFWMAGAGCMLVCENMVMAAASNNATSSGNSLTTVAAGDACASANSHDCCAHHGKHGNKSKKTSGGKATKQPTDAALILDFANSPSGMMADCPLAINATAAISKAKRDESSSAYALTGATALPNALEQTFPLAPPSRLPNRGHTYLHCCVFLI